MLCLTAVGAVVFGIARVSYGIVLVLIMSAVLLASTSGSTRVIASLSSGYRKSVPSHVPDILVTLLVLAFQSAVYAGIIAPFGSDLMPSLWLTAVGLVMGSAVHIFSPAITKSLASGK